jgi:hypothetical protein
MEFIVIQSFTVYIVALFYTVIQCRGYFIASNRDFFK